MGFSAVVVKCDSTQDERIETINYSANNEVIRN